MARAQAVKPVERGRDANRSAGVAAEREIAGIGAARCRRAAGRAAGQPAGRAQIGRGAVMGIGACDAEEEFVADRLAGNRRARRENLRDRGGMADRRLLRRKPVRVAAAGTAPGNVVHVLDHGGEPGKRAGCRPAHGRIEIVGDKERSAHAASMPQGPAKREGGGGTTQKTASRCDVVQCSDAVIPAKRPAGLPAGARAGTQGRATHVCPQGPAPRRGTAGLRGGVLRDARPRRAPGRGPLAEERTWFEARHPTMRVRLSKHFDPRRN